MDKRREKIEIHKEVVMINKLSGPGDKFNLRLFNSSNPSVSNKVIELIVLYNLLHYLITVFVHV